MYGQHGGSLPTVVSPMINQMPNCTQPIDHHQPLLTSHYQHQSLLTIVGRSLLSLIITYCQPSIIHHEPSTDLKLTFNSKWINYQFTTTYPSDINHHHQLTTNSHYHSSPSLPGSHHQSPYAPPLSPKTRIRSPPASKSEAKQAAQRKATQATCQRRRYLVGGGRGTWVDGYGGLMVMRMVRMAKIVNDCGG